MIIPSLIISFVELTTYWLPSHEVFIKKLTKPPPPLLCLFFMLKIFKVTKIHISFTSLVAYTVFQLMIIPEMPTTSEHTPLLSVFIVLQMMFIAYALFGQGFVFLLLDRAENNPKMPPYPPLFKICKTLAPFFKVDIPKELTEDPVPSMDAMLQRMVPFFLK